MPYLIIVLVPLVLAGIAGLIYLGYQQAKKRREALAALAARIGWHFAPDRDRDHDDEYAHFEIFRRGHSRSAYNTLRGDLEIDGRSYPGKMGDFTYRVTRHSGKTTTTTTYNFSYLILHLPFPGVPDLLIRKEGVFDKLAGALGFDDIDFESSEFSRKYHVKSKDKRFAYDVITPGMMEFLLSTGAGTTDIENGRCCLSAGGQRWRPDEFERRIAWVTDFFRLWPEHVIESLEERAAAREP